MARTGRGKEDLGRRVGDVTTLRDQIRVELHLAGMDLRDEWNKLEKKLPDLDHTLEPLKSATHDVLDALVNDLRGFTERLRDGAKHTVAAIMTPAPACSSPADSLAQALTTMWNRDVGCLPVVAPNGAVLGMITDRDAAIASASRGRRMDDIRVDAAMSTNLASCAPSTHWDEALALMRDRQIRRLPVVGADAVLVGMVTLNDVARALGAGAKGSHQPSLAQQIIDTLVAVSGPTHPAIADLS